MFTGYMSLYRISGVLLISPFSGFVLYVVGIMIRLACRRASAVMSASICRRPFCVREIDQFSIVLADEQDSEDNIDCDTFFRLRRLAEDDPSIANLGQ
jgi:hypothetical protein